MKLLAWLLILLIAVAYLSVPVRSQDDDDAEGGADAQGQGHAGGAAGGAGAEGDDDDDEKADVEEGEAAIVLKPSPDVTTTIIFPDVTKKDFPIGERVTLLIGFHNTGSTAFNITGVQAHLHSPFDFNYYIQNFTYREVSAVVEPKQQVSVEYVLQPDKNLEAIQYHLSAFVDYNNTANEQFRSFVHNTTVELVEKASGFDPKSFFSYILVGGAITFLGYIVWSMAKPVSKPTRVERGTREAAANQDDWAGDIYSPKKESAVIKRKKSTKRS